jgi:hypothetical protein
MAQKSTKKQLWLIKPDIDNVSDKNCVILTWQFAKNDQEIRYMVYFNDIDIYVESSSLPKISGKGMEKKIVWD